MPLEVVLQCAENFMIKLTHAHSRRFGKYKKKFIHKITKHNQQNFSIYPSNSFIFQTPLLKQPLKMKKKIKLYKFIKLSNVHSLHVYEMQVLSLVSRNLSLSQKLKSETILHFSSKFFVLFESQIGSLSQLLMCNIALSVALSQLFFLILKMQRRQSSILEFF